MNKIPAIIICLFCTLQLNAQNNLYKLLDAQTKEPIPFANIISTETKFTVMSDSVGQFLISDKWIGSDSIVFSCLAYETKKIAYNDLLKINSRQLSLKYKTYVIGTYTAVADVAKQYLRKAIDNIPGNYDQKAYVLNAFYRQCHFEDDKPVRLIESVQDVAYTNAIDKRHIKVKVENLRRSNNNELNKEQHGDHLFDILLEDPIIHSEGTVLNKKALEFYTCELDTLQTDSTIKILFKSMNYNQDFIYEGYVVLNKGDFAVLNYKSSQKNNPYATKKRQHYSSPYTWQFVRGSKEYLYQKINSLYYVKSIKSNYRNKLLNAQTANIDYKVDEYFELFCENKLSKVVMDASFKNYSGLYSLHYKYNSDFWKSLNLIAFEQSMQFKVIVDLENQFKKNE